VIDSTTLEQSSLVVIGRPDLTLSENSQFAEARSTVLGMLSVVGKIESREDLEAAVSASASPRRSWPCTRPTC